MSDKRALLLLFDGILSHLIPDPLEARKLLLPLACAWVKLDGCEHLARGWEMGSAMVRTYVFAGYRL